MAVRRVSRGELLDHRQWNEIADLANRQQLSPESFTDPSVVSQRARSKSAAMDVRLFRVVNLDDPKTIRCNPIVEFQSVLDFTYDSDVFVRVARPTLLQNLERTRASVAYAVSSIHRLATFGGETIQEQIVPSYATGDVLIAHNVGSGITGIEDVEWLDANYDGRHWAQLES